jgi:protein-L-isoaspartate(D-aspartate) O-methyltransferase
VTELKGSRLNPFNNSIDSEENRRRIEKMVREQLIERGIRDRKLLEAFLKVPRHLFVEKSWESRAYSDYPLPIGEDQTISQPYMAALMSEAMNLTGSEKVLEIGTGSGYQTAVLANLATRVFSVERNRNLARKARKILDLLDYHNIAILVGDGSLGWKQYAPFDAIMVTAGAPYVPESLKSQLKEGGRIVIPVGSRESQVLQIIMKQNDHFKTELKGECSFVPLVGREAWNSEM